MSVTSTVGAIAVGLAIAGSVMSPAHDAPTIARGGEQWADSTVIDVVPPSGPGKPRRPDVSRSGVRLEKRARNVALVAAMRERSAALDQLYRRANRRTRYLEANQWVLPLTSYDITATFGESSYLWSSVHTGVDLAAPSGTPVAAVGTGLITDAGYDGPYGYKVVVRHPDGTESWYAHLTTISVTEGQQVPAGGSVGTVGSTGNVTGPHLHLEVRLPGEGPVDPRVALAQRGVGL